MITLNPVPCPVGLVIEDKPLFLFSGSQKCSLRLEQNYSDKKLISETLAKAGETKTGKKSPNFLRVSLGTLTDWMKRGLPSHHQRGSVYFDKKEVLDYIKDKNKAVKTRFKASLFVCKLKKAAFAAFNKVLISSAHERNRTFTPLREPDFESGASTNSATWA